MALRTCYSYICNDGVQFQMKIRKISRHRPRFVDTADRTWSFYVVVSQRTAKKCTKIYNVSVFHWVSLLRTIFASLARAHERVHVQNVSDFPQTKVYSEINSPFLLNELGDPPIFLLVFAKNSLIKNIFEEEKKFDSGTRYFLENSSQLRVFWLRRGLQPDHGTVRKSALFSAVSPRTSRIKRRVNKGMMLFSRSCVQIVSPCLTLRFWLMLFNVQEAQAVLQNPASDEAQARAALLNPSTGSS